MRYSGLTHAVHPGPKPISLGTKAIMVLGWTIFWGFPLAVIFEVLS